MRRKSERNKAKGSPEKKVEKATRKSSRRRARRSPSTTPEREVESDAVSSAPPAPEAEGAAKGSAENEVAVAEAAKAVVVEGEVMAAAGNEAEAVNLSPEEDNNGSVWKVARADASPGEIQKLKLCRQRNISEASSDNSVERKKSNKWQESGEGVAEEDDSVDEPATQKASAGADDREDPCSRRPDRAESHQGEVSDKEIMPETTPADLSDPMQHADRDEDETKDRSAKVESEATVESSLAETARIDDGSTPAEINAAAGDAVESPRKDQQPAAQYGERETAKKDSESSDDEKSRRSDSSSNTEDTKSRTKVRSSVALTRRKHRDKYHDSSNSESNDSDEEQDVAKNKNEDRKNASSRNDDFEERNDKSELGGNGDDESGAMAKEGEGEEEEDGARIARNEVEKVDDDSQKENKKDQCVAEKTSTTAQKPMKVNLKRSFVRTIDSGLKNDNDDKAVDGETAENKENYVAESKSVPKRRRWGTTITNDITPAFSVSTDSLKVLVPEAKPLSLNEVRLTKDDDIDGLKPRERKHSLNNNVENQKINDDSGRKTDSMDNYTGKRKISIVKETHMNSPSPPALKPTNILLIKNLVRPFTLNQIKELLSRTGKIVENGFWMDRIKSKCFVEYSNEDQAFETRQALHGISWPLSNPKKLQVEYATKEEMQLARESSKDQPTSRKAEAVTSSDTWQQGWIHEEKNNSTKITMVREWDLGKEDGQVIPKEKEREKKEDKKRRQRSTSPNAEAHLPPPARKFKKKDEPPPAKLLDDLFRKTKATPCIYWLPLTNEQIAIKKEMRRQHMAEHARRLEEMKRMERNRDRDRRRRSPRK